MIAIDGKNSVASKQKTFFEKKEVYKGFQCVFEVHPIMFDGPKNGSKFAGGAQIFELFRLR